MYYKAGQATDDNTIRCRKDEVMMPVNKVRHTNTHVMFNTRYFSTVRIPTGTLLHITLHVHCLSCRPTTLSLFRHFKLNIRYNLL